MQTKQHFNPSYGLLELSMNPGDEIHAEAGAMVGKDPTITLETKAKGGVLASLKRSVLGGESFFVNTFKCEQSPGVLYLAPGCDGSVDQLDLKSQALFIQRGSYLANTGDIQVDAKWGGAKTFFSREGLFVLKAEGTGIVFFNSYGALHRVDIQNSSYIVDTGYMVAWTEGLDYQVTAVKGLKNFLFSGEGLVCKLTGTGTLWLQTRNPDSLAAFLHPFRPVEVRKSNNND